MLHFCTITGSYCTLMMSYREHNMNTVYNPGMLFIVVLFADSMTMGTWFSLALSPTPTQTHIHTYTQNNFFLSGYTVNALDFQLSSTFYRHRGPFRHPGLLCYSSASCREQNHFLCERSQCRITSLAQQAVCEMTFFYSRQQHGSSNDRDVHLPIVAPGRGTQFSNLAKAKIRRNRAIYRRLERVDSLPFSGLGG